MNKIIAVTGMCGAGKSVVCDALQKKGWKGVYFGGITMEVLKERNLSVNPENEKMIREELRKTYGMGAFAVLSIKKIKEFRNRKENVYIDGLYSWDEYNILQHEFLNQIYLLTVYTEKKLRYKRLQNRSNRPLSASEATARDISEIENIRKGGPIAFADQVLINNKTITDLQERLFQLLKEDFS